LADEPRNGRNEGRSRRRRYFKRKGERPAGEADAGRERTPAPDAKRTDPARESRPEFRVAHEESNFGAGSSRSRNLRKRRRSRARRGDAAPVTPALPPERDEQYVPPQAVYIYEHVVRPSAGSYEFRSESFSKAGRTLDDYTLDLEHIFHPPAREPVGQVIARVFAEFEAADAVEAARSASFSGSEADESVTPLSSRSAEEAMPWIGRDEEIAAIEASIEENEEAQEPPPGN
jgi:hypothetical protein